MDMAIDYSPDLATMWAAIAAGAVFFAAALGVTLYRRAAGKPPGLLVHCLLVCAAAAAFTAYKAYFPDCPRYLWC